MVTGLVENLRNLPKEHKVGLTILSYRRLEHWIDLQCKKQGVSVIIVNPRGASSTCPKCGSRPVENSHRNLKCPRCGLEADRDTIAIMNIEKRVLEKMGGPLATPTVPQRTDVNPNRCGEPMSRPRKPSPLRARRRSGKTCD